MEWAKGCGEYCYLGKKFETTKRSEAKFRALLTEGGVERLEEARA
jgi:hypothetical protein